MRLAAAFGLAQSLDLATCSRAPHLEANALPALASPPEVDVLKVAGIAGAAFLRDRGAGFWSPAVHAAGALVGLLGATCNLVALG